VSTGHPELEERGCGAKPKLYVHVSIKPSRLANLLLRNLPSRLYPVKHRIALRCKQTSQVEEGSHDLVTVLCRTICSML
jgi:hypothetical protein